MEPGHWLGIVMYITIALAFMTEEKGWNKLIAFLWLPMVFWVAIMIIWDDKDC